ncbi:hypothetical protein ACVWZR_006952 [Bradyrhizobium sp. i1.3.1]
MISPTTAITAIGRSLKASWQGCGASGRAARRWIRAEANVAQAQGAGVTAVAAGEAASNARRMELLRDCDLVPAAGSGVFHRELRASRTQSSRYAGGGLAARQVGGDPDCGFEPVRGRVLSERMLSVLPKLGLIVCRKPPQGPNVLRSIRSSDRSVGDRGRRGHRVRACQAARGAGQGADIKCVAPTMPASGLPQSPTCAICCAARSLIWTR